MIIPVLNLLYVSMAGQKKPSSDLGKEQILQKFMSTYYQILDIMKIIHGENVSFEELDKSSCRHHRILQVV
jgi:hypothetical protein